MFGLLKKSPTKKLKEEHKALLEKAFQAQRNGDIRLYSTLTAEAEAVRAEIDRLEGEQSG